MSLPLPDASLDQLFRTARTYNGFIDQPIERDQLEAIWELLKMGPTSANCLPARLVWVTTPEAKQKLADCAGGANPPKILAAPVTVIIGMDLDFHEQLPWLFPHADAKSWFEGNDALREATAFRNSSLQGGLFHHGGTRARARYRADVGVQQCCGRCSLFWRYAAGEIEFHLDFGLWRSRHHLRAQPAA